MFNTDSLLTSEHLTTARLHNEASRTGQLLGNGSTDANLGIAQHYFQVSEQAIIARLAEPRSLKHLPETFRTLEPGKLGFIGIRGIIDTVVRRMTRSETNFHLGDMVEVEAIEWHYQNQDAIKCDKVLKALKQKFPGRKLRAKSIRNSTKFTEMDMVEWTPWTQHEKQHVGHWITEALTPSPIFTLEGTGEYQSFKLTPEADAVADEMFAHLMLQRRVRLPGTEPFPSWTSARQEVQGAPLTLVKNHAPGAEKAIQAAIDDGRMERSLAAINAVQSITWSINEFVLETLARCVAEGITEPGLPAKHLPDNGGRARKSNRKSDGQRKKLAQDLAIARSSLERPSGYPIGSTTARGSFR